MRKHIVIENKYTAQQAIKLVEDPFSGIIFSYNKVEFIKNEEEDELCIKFEYDVHDDAGLDYDKWDLEQYLGDFLQELILYGIENNDITYSGGLDIEDVAL